MDSCIVLLIHLIDTTLSAHVQYPITKPVYITTLNTDGEINQLCVVTQVSH